MAKASFAIERMCDSTYRNDEGCCSVVGGDARKRWGKGGRQSNAYKFLKNSARAALSPGVYEKI